MSKSLSRNSQIAADQALLAGIQKFLMSYPSLPVDGHAMALTDIVQLLTDRITVAQAAQTADAARAAALKTESDVRAKTAAARQSLRQTVLGMYSGSPDSLAVFGLKPHKASSETVATRAAAAVKATATRKARGTLGSKSSSTATGTPPATPTSPTT